MGGHPLNFDRITAPKVFDEKGVYRQPGPKLCRWCHGPVPKGSRKWCSQLCIDSYLATAVWSRTTAYVYWRDHGICQLCGIDCGLVQRIAERLKVLDAHPDNTMEDPEGKRMPLDLSNAVAWRIGRAPALWFFIDAVAWRKYPCSYSECDHITPRARGGHNAPSNLRNLCQPCHREVTAAFASERATGRANLPQLTLLEPTALAKKHKSHWPKGRKIRSRGFPKIHRPLRRST